MLFRFVITMAFVVGAQASAISLRECLRQTADFFRGRGPMAGPASPSDGENLFVPGPGYARDPYFARRMGEAVNTVAEAFNEAAAFGVASRELVRRQLDHVLVPARVDVAVGDTPPSRERSRRMRQSMFGRRTDGEGKRPQVDYIPNREARGGPFFDKALAFAREGTRFTTRIGAEEVTLGRWELRDGAPWYIHPEESELARIQDAAFDAIAKALNDPSLSTVEVDALLGRAHYLLIHAPPRRRGTATYAHTLVDAARRALYGYGFPNLREGVQLDYEPMMQNEADYIKRFTAGDYWRR